MSADHKVCMVCRTASEPLAPGAERGYQCKVCAEPLQVTSEGIIQIKIRGPENVFLLCNRCGFHLGTRLVEEPPSQGVHLVLHAAAQEHLRRHGISAEDLLGKRKAAPPAVVESLCVLCGDPHSSRPGERVDCRCGASYVVVK